MKHVDAQLLKQMLLSGANNLYNHYPEVDQLNVFPVPDGDTGMNMNLTVSSGSREIENRPDNDDIFALASSFSRGLLMGARGNSGVITSQIFKGFSLALKDKSELTAVDLADAFVSAKEVAYKAVMKPVEGTILTVIREASDALKLFAKEGMTIEETMDHFLAEARKSLEHTPELLPVLKEVGVVDSGGAGLVYLIEGMTEAVHGYVVIRNAEVDEAPTQPVSSAYAGAKLSEDEEGYGYCTQFILRIGKGEEGKKPFDEGRFSRFLQAHGKSIVTVRDDDIVKVHVHTLTPGSMLNYAQQFGEFVTITIENMSEEHDNISRGNKATDYDIGRGVTPTNPAPKPADEPLEPFRADKDFALVAVSSGDGLDEMFLQLGVDVIVSGGQTMNPSTEDFVKAIAKCHARHVFLLPNNSNIVLAASQACEVCDGEEVSAYVVPTKTIPQGLSAAMSFSMAGGDAESILKTMKATLRKVKSGQVTYAIKDTDISGVHITKGFYMAMKDKNIVSCVKDRDVALYDLIASLYRHSSSTLTVIVGEDVNDEDMAAIEANLNEQYGDELEVGVYRGNQSVYSFLVGIE